MAIFIKLPVKVAELTPEFSQGLVQQSQQYFSPHTSNLDSPTKI